MRCYCGQVLSEWLHAVQQYAGIVKTCKVPCVQVQHLEFLFILLAWMLMGFLSELV